MALRIGKQVIAGELRNTRRNGVFGWLEFAPDYGIRIELTGNFQGELAGKHIRFQVERSNAEPAVEQTSAEGAVSADVEALADRQIGVVGDISLRKNQVPDIPREEFQKLDAEAQRQQPAERNSLHLEWFSQNGRVVADIAEVEVEFLDETDNSTGEAANLEPLGDGSYGVGFTEIRIDEDGATHTRNFDLDDEEESEPEEEDPYGLFDQDLGKKMAESLGLEESLGEQLEHVAPTDDPNLTPEEELEDGPEASDEDGTSRNWDDVIPGIDEETKALYEQWDEIFDGQKDEPIAYLFETPLKLPRVEDVTSEEQAQPLVRSILAQLALLNVALDVCEHFDSLDTYRLLMKDILPTAKVHPNLAASEMVLHFSTSDYCQQCSEEYDLEHDDADDESDPDGNTSEQSS